MLINKTKTQHTSHKV